MAGQVEFLVRMGHPGGESIRELTEHLEAGWESSPHFTGEELRLSEGRYDLPKVTLLIRA